MSSLSTDEVTSLAQDLVYQVAYAFYDTPYILLMKILVQLAVCGFDIPNDSYPLPD